MTAQEAMAVKMIARTVQPKAMAMSA